MIEHQRHGCCPGVIDKHAAALENDGSLTGGQFQRVQEIGGPFVSDRGLAECDLACERSRESSAVLQHHVPDGVESPPTAPRHSPDTALGRTPFGDSAVKVKVDDVQPSLRQDQPAIVGSAPRGRVHPGSRRVGADQEWHPVAVATDVGPAFPRVVVSLDVEQLESISCTRRHHVGVRTSLGGGVGHAEDELGHRIPLAGRQFSRFALVVLCRIADQHHRVGQSPVDQVPGTAFGVAQAAVGFDSLADVGTVVAPVGVPGDAIPMIRLGVAQSADRHRRAWHDLVATGDDRGVQHPQQLIGVSVGMAAGTRVRSRGGRGRSIERDPSALDLGVGRIFQANCLDDFQRGRVVHVDQRHGVGDGIEHPGHGRLAVIG